METFLFQNKCFYFCVKLGKHKNFFRFVNIHFEPLIRARQAAADMRPLRAGPHGGGALSSFCFHPANSQDVVTSVTVPVSDRCGSIPALPKVRLLCCLCIFISASYTVRNLWM